MQKLPRCSVPDRRRSACAPFPLCQAPFPRLPAMASTYPTPPTSPSAATPCCLVTPLCLGCDRRRNAQKQFCRLAHFVCVRLRSVVTSLPFIVLHRLTSLRGGADGAGGQSLLRLARGLLASAPGPEHFPHRGDHQRPHAGYERAGADRPHRLRRGHRGGTERPPAQLPLGGDVRAAVAVRGARKVGPGALQ